ncbi:MAG: hypothetical protein IT310_06315 [Anaerolineales bacterium]|nr:hypothetical protein [Anaerolineales bacterium]
MTLNSFLKLEPSYRDYVWGGSRLRPEQVPTAEAWIVWENDKIAAGQHAGKTLGELAAEFKEALLGKKATARTGTRFPLLIKILDCAQWLSLQVHPNDELAVQLEGPNQFGKTEAWHVLEAEPGSKLIAGLKPEVSAELLASSIRDGSIINHVQYAEVQKGGTLLMPAGTLHALGPGLLIYEVQQTSDWTYRVYDWGRPQTETRKLHIEKSVQATQIEASAPALPLPPLKDGAQHPLVTCEYFTLELLAAQTNALELDTQQEVFHAITVIEGKALLQTKNEQIELDKFQTALVPASLGAYQFIPLQNCQALKASP